MHTNNAASKSVILPCIIFLYEKMKNYSTKFFKECLFFVFCLFCFLLLSKNTLHVMFYTYICYWNTFQYKYITLITFHVVKQSHVRVTSKDICLLLIMFFVYFRLILISWSSPPPLLFNWPRVQLYLKLNVQSQGRIRGGGGTGGTCLLPPPFFPRKKLCTSKKYKNTM